MSSTRAAPLLRLLYRLAAGRETVLPDADLLQRYLDRRDEAAFAALVQRHGPMVLGVCRSVLPHAHDAEDAFQATFLVLAHKAASIRRRDGLGSWLHGVARRVALKARAAGIRRQEVEAGAAPPVAAPTLDDVTWGELREALHAELAALPARFREPLVLCYLEGLTQDEAADRLGWSPTTLKGRLQLGRDLLRRGLERRGLAPAVALTAALTGQALAAPVPATLVEATARTAVQFTTQGATASAAALLARGVLQQMASVKLKVLSVALLAVAAVAGGMGLLPRQPAPQAPVTEKLAERQPEPRTDLFGDPLPEGAIARIGTTRLRAYGTIHVVTFSHDGRRLAYGDGHSRVYVCEVADGKALLDLQLGNGRNLPAITELAFSPDGRTLAASGWWSETLWLIDLATRKVRYRISNARGGPLLLQGPGLAYTPDSRTLVVGGKDGVLHLWDPATGMEQAALAKTTEPTLSLTLTADGRTALTAHYGGALHLWDMANRKHLRKLAATAKYPHLTALAPDGKTVALASGATELELWDPDGGRRHQLRTAAPVAGLGFTPAGASLQVADGNGCVTVWDARTGKKRNSLTCEGISQRQTLDDRTGPRTAAWFRPDGKMMVWAVDSPLRLWDLTTGKETPQLALYRLGIQWAGFSADGRLVRTAGGSGELGVWDAVTGRQHVPPRTTHLPRGAHYTPAADRGKVVACTGGTSVLLPQPKPDEGRIFLWDPTGDGGPVPLRGQAEPVLSAALTPDNRFVVATEPTGQIRVYDAATGKPTRSLDGRKYETRLAFSPDGVLLATTVLDGAIRLYDFAAGRLLRELRGPSHALSLVFSPDGRTLASGHVTGLPGIKQPAQPGGTIYLWDPASGRALQRIPTRHRDVNALSFSPDGRLLASCGDDGAVRLWEAASGQERRCYEGHWRWVKSVDFAPNGGRLVSASTDGTALVWQVFGPAPAERPAADSAALWADLARDGITAHRAMAALIAAPRQALPLLRERLRPAVLPDPRQVPRLIAELDSDRFAVRENATKELEGLGELAEPALRKAREGSPPLEFRRRLDQLLEGLQGPVVSPERLRDLRAVEVLERHGGAEARRLLGELAKGAGEARLTREAKVGLARLERR